MQPFIATLSMMFLARGLASTLSTVPERLDPDSPIKELAHQWKLIDGEKVNDLVVTPGVIIAAVVVIGGLLVVHRTRFGRTVYAVGGSEPSANLMGLPVRGPSSRCTSSVARSPPSAAWSTPLGSAARRTSPASVGSSTPSPPS